MDKFGNEFLLLELYVNLKGISVKTNLPNIFEDYHMVATLTVTAMVYHEWTLSKAPWVVPQVHVVFLGSNLTIHL